MYVSYLPSIGIPYIAKLIMSGIDCLRSSHVESISPVQWPDHRPWPDDVEREMIKGRFVGRIDTRALYKDMIQVAQVYIYV